MAKALVLTGINGTRVGDRVTLSRRTNVIGSGSGSDVIIPDRMIEKRHAEVRQVLERWFVVPLDTNAVVFVNGEPVRSQGRITEGDLVTFGSTTFKASFTEIAEPTMEKAIGGSAGAKHTGVPRLGDYLVRRGVITSVQVEEVLERQNELQRQGRRIQFGELLYQMGLVTRMQLEQALQDQRGDFFDHFRD